MPETKQKTDQIPQPKKESILLLWLFYLKVVAVTELHYRQKLGLANEINRYIKSTGAPDKLPPEIKTIVDSTDPFCKIVSRLNFTSKQDIITFDHAWEEMPFSKSIPVVHRRNELTIEAETARRQMVRDGHKELIGLTLDRLHLRKPKVDKGE